MFRTILTTAVVISAMQANANSEISGKVTLAKDVSLPANGVLFVIAKEAGKPMPIAVFRQVNPKFPQDFRLSADNAMIAGTPFKGEYLISARFSPTGDAMDKSGPEGAEPKAIPVGRQNLTIELKSKSSKAQ